MAIKLHNSVEAFRKAFNDSLNAGSIRETPEAIEHEVEVYISSVLSRLNKTNELRPKKRFKNPERADDFTVITAISIVEHELLSGF